MLSIDAAAAQGRGAVRATIRAMSMAPSSLAAARRFVAEGEPDKAAALCRDALAADPDDREALIILGTLAQERGDLVGATSFYERVTECAPDLPEAHHSLAIVLALQGWTEEALLSFDRAIELDPKQLGFWLNRGVALHNVGRLAEAASSLEQAVSLAPDHVDALNALGSTLREMGVSDAALSHLRRAAQLAPRNAGIQLNLALALDGAGQGEDAMRHYDEALALKPDLALARVGRVFASLPIAYRAPDDIARARTAYEAALRDLCRVAETEAGRQALLPAIGSRGPFFLAYQGESDRALQQMHGALICRILGERFPAASLPAPPQAGERIRVGIVSAFIRRHSNWKMPMRGWVEGLDRSKFDLCLYHTGIVQDEETARAAQLATRFEQGPLPLERWRDLILADRPHVLIYPEIGMDETAAKLAALRLAPVQCNSWGHPETSGYPTLDYFLSSALMEPPAAAQHYSERLVPLPNLGVRIEPPDVTPAGSGRGTPELPLDVPAFWCGQSLSKYLPQHDELFPRIARDVGPCRFVFVSFVRGSHVTSLFHDRLVQAFAAYGMDAARHCVMLPVLDLAAYLGAMGDCDVFLDSIGWSGCNSTVESLIHDLPIVTCRGSLMRGRHSAAILERMGMGDCVAETIDDFVRLAVRLARDREYRAAFRARIASGKARLFGDDEPIRALEQFLETAVGRR
jgi:protein O-GlcNAc transferase